MKIGVLAADDSWYYRDLARAAQGLCEIQALPFEALCGTVISQQPAQCFAGDQNLQEFAALLVRTMPPGSLEQVVFRMDLLGRLAAQGLVVLNPPRALETAVDKYLTSALLAAAGLPTPRTMVCQTAASAMQAFTLLGEDVVLKPLFGSEGRGITRLTDEALALRAFRMLEQLGAILYLQEFIPHSGFDIRVLLIGDDAFCMQRCNPHDWRTNVSRGAHTKIYAPTPAMLDLAVRAARAVGTPLAGVDLLPARDGTWHVIEVNAVPGWKALAHTLEIDIAERVLRFTLQQIAAQPGARI